MAPPLRYFVVILIAGMMIQVSCNQKMKFSQSELIGRNRYVSDEQSSAVVETKSLVQCLASCHLAENCQSFVYGESNCYHYGNIFDVNDLTEKVGYNYFIVKTKEPRTKSEIASITDGTTTEPTTTSTTTIPSTTEIEKKYTLYKEKTTWDNAERTCEANHARLACIHDKETNDKVTKLIEDSNPDSSVWIGLETVSKESPFRWTDGIEVSQDKNDGYFHDFYSEDPNIYNKQDNVGFAVVFLQEYRDTDLYGKWVDEPKSDWYWYLCEEP